MEVCLPFCLLVLFCLFASCVGWLFKLSFLRLRLGKHSSLRRFIMKFVINRSNYTCSMQYSNGRTVEITMQEPSLAQEDDVMYSELVKIKYFDSQGELVDEFKDVTSDEFGGMLKEIQYISDDRSRSLIDQVQVMDEAMHAGEPPVLTQADLQGGSDNE